MTIILSQISIHAPHTGHDKLVDKGRAAKAKFQSTRPIRGTTWISGRNACALQISIHAPHTGHDNMDHYDKRQLDISIHAPHTGHDLGKHEVLRYVPIFQSTRPIRGTTVASPAILACMIFQSTRPIRGTTASTLNRWWAPSFQSTRPIRGTTKAAAPEGSGLSISIHAPHTGHD